MTSPLCGKHSHLHAARRRSLARYEWQPWRMVRLRHQKSRWVLCSFPPPGFFGGTSGKLGKAFTAFIGYFSMSLISFISGLSWISPSCSRRNLANTNPGAGLVSRVSLSERSYLSSTPIMSFSPCFKKRKDSCSFCHPTSPFPTEQRRSKFGIKLIWPKLWEKQPRCIRVGGTEGGPPGKSGRMAITSKNIHKIKHQRERQREPGVD